MPDKNKPLTTPIAQGIRQVEQRKSSNDNQLILGFVGEMASGKGTAAAYCKHKYGALNLRFSTILRETLDRVYLPHTRDNMIFLSETLRGHFGDDILAYAMKCDVQKAKNNFITIDGIRRPADLAHLKNLPNFHLIGITADAKLRFQRLKKRKENKDDRTKTWRQFQKDSNKSTEKTIKDVANHAEFVIDNNGTFKHMYKQIDDICTLLLTA